MSVSLAVVKKLAFLTLLLGSTSTLLADEPLHWPFDIDTTGQDVFWTSDSSVRTDAAHYDAFYEIQLLEVWVSWEGILFGPFDMTDQIPPDQQTGSQTHIGPPPFIIADEDIVYPEPPEDPSVTGHLFMQVDSDGYGQMSFTDIQFGTMIVDLGFPLGEQEVQIEEVHLQGYVDVTAVGIYIPGDLDGDSDVDQADLGILLSSYGIDDGGDIDGDGDTDQADLGILLSNYGAGT